MLRRVMAMVLSVCMIAALFTAVSAEETVVGGGVVSSSFTDDFTTLDKAYEITNFKSADAIRQIRKDDKGERVVIAKVTNDTTVEGTAQNIKTLAIDNSGSAATIVYRAAENKFFTSVDVNIWRENGIITPAISYSNDGENWTDIVKTSGVQDFTPAKYGWTQTQDGGSEDNDWIGIHNNDEKDVPHARFVKISFPIGSGAARIVDISLTVGGGVISSSLTDDFTTLDNAYSVTNFEKAAAVNQGGVITNAELSGSTAEPKTINTLIMSKHTKEAEIIYRAADNKRFASVDVDFWRQNDVKFPEIAYSENGSDWKPIVSASNSAEAGNDGWSLSQSPNDTNNWIAVHNNKLKDISGAKKDISGAKFVKITFPKDTVEDDNERVNARIINISLTVANMISESLTENFETLDNAYSVTNFEKAAAVNQGGVITNAELSGSPAKPKTINTLIMSKHTEKAEIIYRAADNKRFTNVNINFWRHDQVKFPEVAYSENGSDWTVPIPATDSVAWGNDTYWTLPQSPSDTNNWIAVHNNKLKDISGAKFVKITFPANTVGYVDKRGDARIIDLTLTVDDVAYANTLSVTANGTATLANAGGKADGAKLFIAEYKSDGILINAAAYSVAPVNGSFERTLEKTADGAYFKAFLFGGESGTEPITAAATSKN